MTIRNLDYLFKPSSIALIGASKTGTSVGAQIANNLFQGGFDGPIMPVNPHHRAVQGVRRRCFRRWHDPPPSPAGRCEAASDPDRRTQSKIGDTTPEKLDALDLAPGSMDLKVAAASVFVRKRANVAGIGSLADTPAILDGRAGTRVIPTSANNRRKDRKEAPAAGSSHQTNMH